MTKNSKKVASDSIMNDVMGMFMFEKRSQDKKISA